LFSSYAVNSAKGETVKNDEKRGEQADRCQVGVPKIAGTVYVNGSCLGPAEMDPATGNIEQGPHVTRRLARAGDIMVVRIDRSPMNACRWLVGLSCGHEIWIGAKRKPTRKTYKCVTCEKAVTP
jgi:hypothetical protein